MGIVKVLFRRGGDGVKTRTHSIECLISLARHHFSKQFVFVSKHRQYVALCIVYLDVVLVPCSMSR